MVCAAAPVTACAHPVAVNVVTFCIVLLVTEQLKVVSYCYCVSILYCIVLFAFYMFFVCSIVLLLIDACKTHVTCIISHAHAGW